MSGQVEVAFAGTLGAFALDVAFTAPARGITALFGPSGCGKTTVLRCIAGLHRAARGRCVVDGDVWQDAVSFRPAHRRAVGYVFQEASLFAHLSVRRNLLFGAPRRGNPAIALHDVVELLRLEALLDRSPQHLSGGERQRVAIGRALLSQPRLLLMDEPLSALDRRSRDEILPFLERLHDTLALPIFYVTHDMGEVERLADHLVLMHAGRVAAAGTLGDLQSDAALPLAGARDAAVSLPGRAGSFDAGYGLLSVEIAGGTVLMPSSSLPPGQPLRVRIAARDVSLAARAVESSILNCLPARIVAATEAGGFELVVTLALGEAGDGARLLSRLTQRSWDQLGLTVGGMVYAQVKGVALA